MYSLEKISKQYKDQFIKRFLIRYLDEDDRKNLRTTSSTMKLVTPRAHIIYRFWFRPARCRVWLSSVGRVHIGTELFEEPQQYISFLQVKSKLQSNVKNLFGGDAYACAALKKNGELITWGSKRSGGDSNSVAHNLNNGITKVSMRFTDSFALKSNGQLIFWGETSEILTASMCVNVSNFANNSSGLVIFKTNGEVIILDESRISSVHYKTFTPNVIKTVPAIHGFAFLKSNGEVEFWGRVACPKEGDERTKILNQLKSNVIDIVGVCKSTFIALKDNGDIISWGSEYFGGDIANKIQIHNVKKMTTSYRRICLLRHDGSVFCYGGTRSDTEQERLQMPLSAKTGVRDIIQDEYVLKFKAWN